MFGGRRFASSPRAEQSDPKSDTAHDEIAQNV